MRLRSLKLCTIALILLKTSIGCGASVNVREEVDFPEEKQHTGRSILKYNPSTALDGSIAIIDGVTAVSVPSTQFVQETSGVPPPPPPSVFVAAANVRAVSSAAELLQAVQDGVLDIEVTAHIDLRELSVVRNPYLMPNGPRERFFTHTMYVDSLTRSIRGNCNATTDRAVLVSMTEATAGRVEYPPLQPFQCVLMMDKPFLWDNNSTVWLDHLYFAVARDAVDVDFVMLQYGTFFFADGVPGHSIYITDSTFVGGGLGSTRAVATFEAGASVLIEDCIFSSFTGDLAPLTFVSQARATVRRTAFRDFDLQEEIFDVSIGSSVHLENCTFTNITVPDNEYVSTSYSDWSTWQGDVLLTYYPDDDDGPDFDVERVRANDSTPPIPGVDTWVESDTMSDCLFCWKDNLPGCPEPLSKELKEQYLRRAVRLQGLDPDDVIQRNGTFTSDQALDYSTGELLGEDYEYEPLPVAEFIMGNDAWLAAMRKELPKRAAAPDDFDPVFSPPALDPARNLPKIISAGTSIPPAPSTPALSDEAAQSTSAGDGRDSASEVETSEGSHRIQAIVSVSVASFLAFLFCVICGAAVLRRRWRSNGGLDGRMESMHDVSTQEPQRSCSSRASKHARNDTTHACDAPQHRQGSKGTKATPLHAAHDHERIGKNSRATFPPTSNPMSSPGVNSQLFTEGSMGGSLISRSQQASDADKATNSTRETHITDMHNVMYPTQGSSECSLPAEGGDLAIEPQEAGSLDYALADSKPRRPGLLRMRSVTEGSAPGRQRCHSPASPLSNTPLRLHMHSMHHTAPALGSFGSESSVLMPAPHMAARVAQRPPGDTTLRNAVQWGEFMIDQGVATASVPGMPLPRASRDRSLVESRTALSNESSTRSSGLTLSSIVRDALGAAGGGSAAGQPGSSAAQVTDVNVGATDLAEGQDVAALVGRRLNNFNRKDLFLGRFRMLGRDERRRGGQAVVQFAESIRDKRNYAIKFFLDEESFFAEAALYAAVFPNLKHNLSSAALAIIAQRSMHRMGDRVLQDDVRDDASDEVSAMQSAGARFLPQVEALRDGGNGDLMDPNGNALPPCIVMERGESLQDWATRAEPDMFQSLALLINVTERLALMHDAGFVHRDLKPANVMWLPRENRWTIIDFGCAARTNTAAPISFTLAYAAPEVLRAVELKSQTISCDSGIDAWSLGVMAFELLTGAPAFRLVTDGIAKVMAQLRGDELLPWEGQLAPHVRQKLGAFKEPVLQLLSRNPANRISMQRFHDACMHLFSAHSTTSTADFATPSHGPK